MSLTIKSALEIFNRSKSQTDSDFIISNFAESSDVDKTQIVKAAVISKLHRYKEKLKRKRGKQKEEFENVIFSIPVATSSSTNVCRLYFYNLKGFKKKETVIPETSDDEDRPDIQIYAFDAKTISFLRFCGKCFGRGVDEKSGCYSAFKTYCQRENENVMFVDFRGNRFNIILLIEQRIKAFFEIVHGENNQLHKLTLQLVKNQHILACCKVLGLISKLITAPL
ncbi:unnamed protein product [Mytilus edulis]|uniref:Uncharacterized protein n=1 Tax=Mytilus edulis TaxID=6550 RepID=A0A8S3R1L7_MYTED|nr:unnamed protein product [Mytilus edulis]